MAYIVRMPKLGVEMEFGEVLEWHVGVGDAVEEGAVIAEIESEKTVSEVTARESGTLREIFLEAGEGAEPGEPIGIVAPLDADISELESEVGEATSVLPDTDSAEPGSEEAQTGTGPEDASNGATAAVKATPKAKKRASEFELSLETVEGTGPQGAVTSDDVERAAENETEASGTSMTVRDESELSPTRRTIAERLGQSYRSTPHVTVHRTIDIETTLDQVEEAKEHLEPEAGLLDILLLATSATLADHPGFNATFEDGVNRIYEEHNLAFAVDAETGLLTPVLGDVSEQSLDEVARERRRLTEQALAGALAVDDLTGGTFTLSNLGVLGIDTFTPIINPPQVAILGVGRPREWPYPSGNGIAFRRELSVSLSFDHRVLDGADAARFLETLATKLTTPGKLIDEPDP